jgi:hypothetical protein
MEKHESQKREERSVSSDPGRPEQRRRLLHQRALSTGPAKSASGGTDTAQGMSVGISRTGEDAQIAQTSSIAQQNVLSALTSTKEDSPVPQSGSTERQKVHLNVKLRKDERIPRNDFPRQRNIQTTVQDRQRRLQDPPGGPHREHVLLTAYQQKSIRGNSLRTQAAGGSSQMGQHERSPLNWEHRTALTDDQLLPGSRPMTYRSSPKSTRGDNLTVFLETKFMIAPKGSAQLRQTMTAFLQTLVENYNTQAGEKHTMTHTDGDCDQDQKWYVRSDYSAPPPTRQSPRKLFSYYAQCLMLCSAANLLKI